MELVGDIGHWSRDVKAVIMLLGCSHTVEFVADKDAVVIELLEGACLIPIIFLRGRLLGRFTFVSRQRRQAGSGYWKLRWRRQVQILKFFPAISSTTSCA